LYGRSRIQNDFDTLGKSCGVNKMKFKSISVQSTAFRKEKARHTQKYEPTGQAIGKQKAGRLGNTVKSASSSTVTQRCK